MRYIYMLSFQPLSFFQASLRRHAFDRLRHAFAAAFTRCQLRRILMPRFSRLASDFQPRHFTFSLMSMIFLRLAPLHIYADFQIYAFSIRRFPRIYCHYPATQLSLTLIADAAMMAYRHCASAMLRRCRCRFLY